MPIVSTTGLRPTTLTTRDDIMASYERLDISVPSDRAGEAISTLRALASVALPEVSLSVSRPKERGLNAIIEVVAGGTPEELAQLKNLIASSISSSVSAPVPTDRAAARRLLAIDAPSLPGPVPEQPANNLLHLRMEVLAGRYVHPEPTTFIESWPHPMD